MTPYSVTLADGAKAMIVEKTSGRKRSINLLLFKIRRPRTLIAYSVQVQELQRADYTVYKERASGNWHLGGQRNKNRLTILDHKRVKQIKTAIDHYESGI